MEDIEIGKLIQERRKELGMTSTTLANRIGVNQSTISRWENGQIRTIRRSQVYLLSKYLYIPIDTLIGLSNVRSTINMDIVKKRIKIESKIDKIEDLEKLENIEKIIDALI